MAKERGRCLVIPAAGNGRRFADKGYAQPKPFVLVHGRPMVEVVVRNMRDILGPIHVVLILRDDMKGLAATLDLDDVEFMYDVDPRGTAATLMNDLQTLDPTTEVIIANSDQVVCFDRVAFESASDGSGTILAFECPERDVKWSYAEVNTDGEVIRVAEKVPISEHATVGVYRFARAEMLIEGVRRMIAADDRTNGEFYLCPTFNHIEANVGPVRIVHVTKMWGLGTPEDLEASLKDESFAAYVKRI